MHVNPNGRVLLVALLLVLGACGIARSGEGPTPEPIDWNRARQLYQRDQQGGALTAEERAYLDRARAERQRAFGGPNGAGGARMEAKPSLGITPLCDLPADGKYQGTDGGLYGGGSNEPPAAQAGLAAAAAAKIVPLDAEGKPSPNGKMVLLSIGMSNTTMEFSRFKELADWDREKSPRLVVVDGAQGGKDAAAWTAEATANGNAVWDEADRRIAAAGVSPRQVQILWVKQALIQAARFGDFPAHAKELQRHLATILKIVKTRYPNARLLFLSSRIYAGYASTALNPEPYAYESAFAVRWLIEDQIKGEADLNCDPARGPVKAPVALWGPYLWADGTKGRKAGDLVYTREDVGGDGTHPSAFGRQKVAELLLRFFKTNPYAKGWFLRRAGDPAWQTPAGAPPRAPDAGTDPGAANAAGIDWNRARALYERARRGEPLTPEERRYLEKARAARQRSGQG